MENCLYFGIRTNETSAARWVELDNIMVFDLTL
jgi:predicted methyltransferase